MEELDYVRVTALLSPDRDFDGTEGAKRQPRIGDEGTIVHVYVPGESFVVECVDSDGYTVWLADFVAAELEELHK